MQDGCLKGNRRIMVPGEVYNLLAIYMIVII